MGQTSDASLRKQRGRMGKIKRWSARVQIDVVGMTILTSDKQMLDYGCPRRNKGKDRDPSRCVSTLALTTADHLAWPTKADGFDAQYCTDTVPGSHICLYCKVL